MGTIQSTDRASREVSATYHWNNRPSASHHWHPCNCAWQDHATLNCLCTGHALQPLSRIEPQAAAVKSGLQWWLWPQAIQSMWTLWNSDPNESLSYYFSATRLITPVKPLESDWTILIVLNQCIIRCRATNQFENNSIFPSRKVDKDLFRRLWRQWGCNLFGRRFCLHTRWILNRIVRRFWITTWRNHTRITFTGTSGIDKQD